MTFRPGDDPVSPTSVNPKGAADGVSPTDGVAQVAPRADGTTTAELTLEEAVRQALATGSDAVPTPITSNGTTEELDTEEIELVAEPSGQGPVQELNFDEERSDSKILTYERVDEADVDSDDETTEVIPLTDKTSAPPVAAAPATPKPAPTVSNPPTTVTAAPAKPIPAVSNPPTTVTAAPAKPIPAVSNPPATAPRVSKPPATAPAAVPPAPVASPQMAASPVAAAPPVPPEAVPIPVGSMGASSVPPPVPAAATAASSPPGPGFGSASPSGEEQETMAQPSTVLQAVAPAASQEAKPPPRRRPRVRDWFEEIFDEDYLRTLPYLTAQQTLREVDFVEASLNVIKGGRLLDLGTGYGRHALELAARGHHVVGIDLSLPLLIRAADEAQRRGLDISFVHGDMRELTFEEQFEGVFCLFSTFGYFDDEANRNVAAGIGRALRPKGRLLLEVLHRDYVLPELPTRVWWEGDGCIVLEEIDFNYFQSRLVCHRTLVFEDGRQVEQDYTIRAYSLHEMGRLLHDAGFRVLEVSGNLATKGNFFGAESRTLLVTAEKIP